MHYEDYSCKDLYKAYNGYWIAHNIKERGQWERARWVSFYSSVGKLKNVKKPNDIYLFDWEKKEKIGKKGSPSNPYTIKEIEEIEKRLQAKKNG